MRCLLTLKVSKVTLRVRFPCSVCCALKIDNSEHDLYGQAQLKNGEADLSLSHTQEITLPRQADSPGSKKKCFLLLYLKSTSGKIPAGNVALPMRPGQPLVKELARVDKCPDKSALVELEVGLQRLGGELTDLKESSVYQLNHFGRQSSVERRVRQNRRVSPTSSVENSRSVRRIKHSNTEHSIKTTTLNRRMMLAATKEERPGAATDYYGSDDLSSSEKMMTLERQNQNSKTKVAMLERQVSAKASSISQLERQTKQLGKRNQQVELELRAAQSKVEVAEKSCRSLANEIKGLKETIDEQRLSHQNSLKRIEIRQSGVKEQLRNLTDKLYASQNEKQLLLFEKSQLCSEFEGREKALREEFKSKERRLIEEKNLSVRNIDQFEREREEVELEARELKSKMTEAQQEVREFNLIIEGLQNELERSRIEAGELRFDLTKLHNEKKILQQNLQEMARYQQERRGYRRQLSQKEIECSQLKDKISALQSAKSKSSAQTQSLDRQLKEKTAKIRALEQQYASLASQERQTEAYLGEQESKITALMNELQLQMKKSRTSQMKVTRIQEEFEDQRDQWHQEQATIKRRNKQVEEQLEQMSQELFSESQKMTSLERELANTEEVLQGRNKELKHLEERIQELTQAVKEYESERMAMEEEKAQFEEQVRIKIKEEEQKFDRLLRSKEQSEEKHQQQMMETGQTIDRLNDEVQDLEAALNKAESTVVKSQEAVQFKNEEVVTMRDEKESVKHELEQAMAQIGYKDKDIRRLKQELSEAQTTNESLRETVDLLQQKERQLTNQKDQLEQDLTEYEQHRRQWEAMRKNMEESLDKMKFSRDEVSRQYKKSQSDTEDLFVQLFTAIASEKEEADYTHSSIEVMARAQQIMEEVTKMRKEFRRTLRSEQARAQQAVMTVELMQGENSKKQEHIEAVGANIEELRRSQYDAHAQLKLKNQTIRDLQRQVQNLESELEEYRSSQQYKSGSQETALSSKNKEIASLREKLKLVNSEADELREEVNTLRHNEQKMSRESKSLETSTKLKVKRMESTLRDQTDKVNYLETEKQAMERQLRQQKENLRKTMRELQKKCLQLQELENQDSTASDALKIKATQNKKLKDQINDLRQILAIIAESEETGEEEAVQRLSEIGTSFNARDRQSIKGQLYEVCQDYLRLRQETTIFGQKFKVLNSQKEAATKQISRLEADLKGKKGELERALQQMDVVRFDKEEVERNYNSIFGSNEEMASMLEQHRNSVETTKNAYQQLQKLLFTMQKEKKIGFFAMNSIKECLKNVENALSQQVKKAIRALSRVERDADLSTYSVKSPTLKPKKKKSERPE